jgi:hypothetical protein
MGFNTVVHILNDMLYELQEHPKEFVDYIVSRMNGGPKYGSAVSNAVEVCQTHHASDYQLCLSGGNTIFSFSHKEIDELLANGHDKYLDKIVKEAQWQVTWMKKYLAEQRAIRESLLYKAQSAVASHRRQKKAKK